MWRLVRITRGPAADEDFVFEHEGGRRVTVQWWHSIDKMFCRVNEGGTLIKAPQTAKDAVVMAVAYCAMKGTHEGFKVEVLL